MPCATKIDMLCHMNNTFQYTYSWVNEVIAFFKGTVMQII